MFTALFVGSIVFTVGDVPTTNLLLQNAMGFPAMSVKLLACNVIVYKSTFNKLVGVMVRILLFMFVVMGITVPMLFVRYIVPFPVLIGSLNVIVITLFCGTCTALFVGSIVFTVGDVPTTNLLLQNAMGFPAISVKLPFCKVIV